MAKLFVLALFFVVSSVAGQEGATCASRIAALWPRKMFDVERVRKPAEVNDEIDNYIIIFS